MNWIAYFIGWKDGAHRVRRVHLLTISNIERFCEVSFAPVPTFDQFVLLFRSLRLAWRSLSELALSSLCFFCLYFHFKNCWLHLCIAYLSSRVFQSAKIVYTNIIINDVCTVSSRNILATFVCECSNSRSVKHIFIFFSGIANIKYFPVRILIFYFKKWIKTLLQLLRNAHHLAAKETVPVFWECFKSFALSLLHSQFTCFICFFFFCFFMDKFSMSASVFLYLFRPLSFHLYLST